MTMAPDAHPAITGPLAMALLYDGLCTFEFGIVAEVFGLHRPEMGPGWYRFASCAIEPGPLRAHGGFLIQPDNGPDLHVHGNIVDHEYKIERDDTTVAEVSKRWFRVRDTYGVEVFPGQDDILIMAATAVIDTMAYPDG